MYLFCYFFLQLPLDHLQENLSKEMAKLKEMAPHLCEQQDGQGDYHTYESAQGFQAFLFW